MVEQEADAQLYCAQAAPEGAYEKLAELAAMLIEENSRQNLIAASSLEEIWRRHMADSLQLLEHVPRGTSLWLDLGSGGGFPGLALAAAAPDRSFLLVESRRLRAEWLVRAAEELALSNVEVSGRRLETVRSREVGVISARAFAPLPKLLRLAERFSTSETIWVLPKGRSAGDELLQQPPAIQRMFHVEPSLTDPAAGILVGRGVPDLQ